MKFVASFFSNYRDCKPENKVIGVYDTEKDAVEALIGDLCDRHDYSFGFEHLSNMKKDGDWEEIKNEFYLIVPNIVELDDVNDRDAFRKWAINSIKKMYDLNKLCELFNDSYYNEDNGWTIEIKSFQ